MIKCKKCGRLNQDYTSLCPNCSSPMELTQAEVEELFSELDDRLEMNDFTRVVDIHKLLAEAGVVEGRLAEVSLASAGAFSFPVTLKVL